MAMVHHIDIQQLLPKTDHYITYDGSLTQPGCYETVTWILYNKPAIISREQVNKLKWCEPLWPSGKALGW